MDGVEEHTEIDKKLLLRLKNGEQAAFDELFWHYNVRVYNFVLSLLHNKSLAEDITQTCFLKIWERHADIDPEKGFASYLYTIARNLVYKETEKLLLETRFMEYAKEKLSDLDNSTQNELDIAFLQQYVDRLIDRLPPSRRRIFNLSRKEGLSTKEIAARLSISEKTVETQICRSVAFLKRHFKDYLVLIGLLYLGMHL